MYVREKEREREKGGSRHTVIMVKMTRASPVMTVAMSSCWTPAALKISLL